MEQAIVKTPKYWEDPHFGEKVEVETIHGNKVRIPKKYINGWQTTKLMEEDARRRGLDPLDGMENIQDVNPIYYDLLRVFYEIYEEDR